MREGGRRGRERDGRKGRELEREEGEGRERFLKKAESNKEGESNVFS